MKIKFQFPQIYSKTFPGYSESEWVNYSFKALSVAKFHDYFWDIAPHEKPESPDKWIWLLRTREAMFYAHRNGYMAAVSAHEKEKVCYVNLFSPICICHHSDLSPIPSMRPRKMAKMSQSHRRKYCRLKWQLGNTTSGPPWTAPRP